MRQHHELKTGEYAQTKVDIKAKKLQILISKTFGQMNRQIIGRLRYRRIHSKAVDQIAACSTTIRQYIIIDVYKQQLVRLDQRQSV